MGALYRMVIDQLMKGDGDEVEKRYLFDASPLTNDRPYFAGYIKIGDLPTVLGMLDAVSDEWGYLLLWGTLAESILLGLVLLLAPVIFGWRTIFSRQPGKIGIVTYFLCLGLGYIFIEVGLIGKFVLALANPTVSASVLITGMLVFSGLGSLTSGRYLERCRKVMPRVFIAIATILVIYSFILGPILDVIGLWPYGWRIVACLAAVAAACLPDGISLPHRHGHALAPGQGTFLPLGLGHQRAVLGGRFGRRAAGGRAVRPEGADVGGGRSISSGAARFLRPAAAESRTPEAKPDLPRPSPSAISPRFNGAPP